MKKALGLLVVAAIVGIGLRHILPKDVFAIPKSKKHIDEMLAETLKEVKQQTEKKAESPTVVTEKTVQITDTLAAFSEQGGTTAEENVYLNLFFKKLKKAERRKKGQVRIAYFGDSMLDADMLVMQFRHAMQQRFGGLGVGFVPICSPSASGRNSIKHSFAPQWQKQSFIKKRNIGFLYGLNGETFYVGDTANYTTAWVSYRRGTAYKNTPLIHPTLFYGQAKSIDSIALQPTVLTVTTKQEGEQNLSLSANRMLNAISLPNHQKSLKLTLQDQGVLPLYGLSFASKQGVIVDNLATRGNSGLPLTRLSPALMHQFHKYFKYDLVVLSFGTNVFSPTYKGFGWYGRRMQKVVRHIQNCFPKTEVLIVSMADRAMKIDDEMQTPKELPGFIREQKRIADSTQSGFFNLYDAMGGAGSMVQWVEAEPSLANKDYTHFNSRGAEKAAKLLYKWLMNRYENYLKAYPEKKQQSEEDSSKLKIAYETDKQIEIQKIIP